MTLPVTTSLPLPPPSVGQDIASPASQSIFEHMAQQAQAVPQGASPSQLGAKVMDNLDGFIDRSQRFAAHGAGQAPQQSPMQPPAQPGQSAESGQPKTTDQQLKQVVDSLSVMFDHSIETQMVVRGATQVSGAANTLLRGQ